MAEALSAVIHQYPAVIQQDNPAPEAPEPQAQAPCPCPAPTPEDAPAADESAQGEAPQTPGAQRRPIRPMPPPRSKSWIGGLLERFFL